MNNDNIDSSSANANMIDLIHDNSIKVMLWDTIKRNNVPIRSLVDRETPYSIVFKDGSKYRKPQFRIIAQFL